MTHASTLPARCLVSILAVLGITSCGSGAVSAPPTPVTPAPLSVNPATAALFSELPTSFVVSGGTPPYFVTSSDQATVPVIGTVSGSTFTAVPNPVAAETPVTLTISDSAGATPVAASLTVRPRTVSNVVTITPSATQPAACGTAICAAGDAEVRVTLSQAGLPLRNRTVRFDVVSGDFRIITSAAGTPETLSLSATTFTDDTGTARMRIRVLADAGAQTGLLQITDVGSGFSQRASLTVAPSSSSPLNAQPDRIQFIGRDSDTCANSTVSADVIVFGGRPPYSITQPGTFSISPLVLNRSGERFTVTANGQCTAGSLIAIVDSASNTVTVTASNSVAGISVNTPALVVSPQTVTLTACAPQQATVNIAGGLGAGTYVAASGSTVVDASVPSNSNIGVISRRPGSGPITTPVQVGFSDGRSVVQVTVNFEGAGAGVCPP